MDQIRFARISLKPSWKTEEKWKSQTETARRYRKRFPGDESEKVEA
jgi:hypothetical protein